uniref:Uncharacterized protein n=1 Tax=candidate division WOR-3 bacterium TaxID=2052148 RepID=A0A7V3PUJ4_UNCW3
MVRRILLLTLSGFGLVVFVQCRTEFEPPVIEGIFGNTRVQVRDSCLFECRVAPGAKGPLSFQWWCSGGRFEAQRAERGKWYAPESSGTVSIGVEVTDGLDRKTADSIEVQVEPRVVTFVNWEGAIKAGESVYFSDSCIVGYRLSGTVRSDTGNVYLIFLDEGNFYRWQQGLSYQPRIRRLAYQSIPLNDTIPVSGIYYLVLDNSGNFNDCSYRINIQLTSP